ncbi:Predicted peptidase [Tessaracoccus bendigoensis DSM 12906]|uniref:Predicted peptidase n=1 Tax=Tessaracoccus bendigoensis DSM 12906 TaxID=1123357 RepID=A0A1M6IS23_9ACTN|nr:PHB depolymerase family esterase [Tessaracoccus bendigoensis]SHJ37266.1 Predicted peptidase [Tessaracoccus bendigoensis DSM 12906]
MKKLRNLIAVAATTVAMLMLAIPQAEAHPRPPTGPSTATFTLNAEVLDSGQQVVALTIDPGKAAIRASSLDADTFSVTATGTQSYSAAANPVIGTFADVDRPVTSVKVDRRGRIVIGLEHGFNVPGASTFAWGVGANRNLMLDLTYTVTQNKPVKLRDGSSLTFKTLKQGKLVDPEVDVFRDGKAAGLYYRLYDPQARGKRPLVIWLHGGGEGGWAEAQNNDLSLVANRGAVGFVTKEAQRVFAGAYVLAPQATDFWMNDAAMGYSAKLKKLIDEVVKRNSIDRSRIYVVGASNGGYMTARLVVDNPGFFAAQVPIAPGVVSGGQSLLSDAELGAIKTPTWVVQAKNDATLPFAVNGEHMANTIPKALLTAYDDVTWDGVTYNGHWSWIYVARNDPSTAKGLHIWQWMAKQSLGKAHK